MRNRRPDLCPRCDLSTAACWSLAPCFVRRCFGLRRVRLRACCLRLGAASRDGFAFVRHGRPLARPSEASSGVGRHGSPAVGVGCRRRARAVGRARPRAARAAAGFACEGDARRACGSTAGDGSTVGDGSVDGEPVGRPRRRLGGSARLVGDGRAPVSRSRARGDGAERSARRAVGVAVGAGETNAIPGRRAARRRRRWTATATMPTASATVARTRLTTPRARTRRRRCAAVTRPSSLLLRGQRGAAVPVRSMVAPGCRPATLQGGVRPGRDLERLVAGRPAAGQALEQADRSARNRTSRSRRGLDQPAPMAAPAGTPSARASVRCGRNGSRRAPSRRPRALVDAGQPRARSSSPSRTPSQSARGRPGDGKAPAPPIDDVERPRGRRRAAERRRSRPRRGRRASGRGTGASGAVRRGGPSGRRGRRPGRPAARTPSTSAAIRVDARPAGAGRRRTGAGPGRSGARPARSTARPRSLGRSARLALPGRPVRRAGPRAPGRASRQPRTSTVLSSSSLYVSKKCSISTRRCGRTCSSRSMCGWWASPIGDAQDLEVEALLVAHLEAADRAGPDVAAGEGRLVDDQQGVGVVAVAGAGALDEAVVEVVVDGARQHAIEPEDAGLLVVLVLVAATRAGSRRRSRRRPGTTGRLHRVSL